MKAAKFGGKFEVKKTKRVSTTTDVTDFRKEMQKSMNKMAGTAKSEFNVGSELNFIKKYFVEKNLKIKDEK